MPTMAAWINAVMPRMLVNTALREQPPGLFGARLP